MASTFTDRWDRRASIGRREQSGVIEPMSIFLLSTIALALALPAAGSTADGAPAASARPERLVGVLARAHGDLAFAPCEGEAQAAVDATAGGNLVAQVDWLLDGHDGAVRLEADAIAEDGGWRLVHLRRAGHVEPGCPRADAIDYVWSAADHGGWRLLATPRSVRVSGVEGLDGRRFRFAPFVRGEDGSYRYAADAGGERFEVELAPAICRSGDREGHGAVVSDYRAVLSWRGRQWVGCAHNGRAAR